MQIEYNEARFFCWDAAFIIQRFYFQYQTEALPHGESIQSFCVKNKVPYNIFSKWYKDTRKQIVEVKVDGRPSDSEKEPSVQSDTIRKHPTPILAVWTISATFAPC